MPADWPAWAGSGEPAARRLQARIRGPSPVCRSVLFGSHSILEKKKISSKLSTFKTRESSPKKIGFPFSNNNNKSKHFCVVYCVWCPSKRLASLCSPDWESSVLGRFCAAGVRLAVSRLLQLGQPRRWPRLLLVVCVPAWQPWARAGGGLGTRPPLTSASPALCTRVPPLPGPRLGVHWTWTVLSVERSGWVRGGTLLISALSHSSLAHPSRP